MAETLLDIVQEILSDSDGDEVNSITDTEESEQCAKIVISTYQAMMSNSIWPHTRRLVQLVPYSDNTQPTHMSLDENIKELISIYYDKKQSTDTQKKYEEVKYKSPDDFLRYVHQRRSDDAAVMTVVDPSGVELFIRNDQAPSYFTSFDDVTLVFDSYDSSVDSTLQSSKVQALAYIIPVLNLLDNAEPDLPIDAFSALKEQAKSVFQFRLRQIQDIKAEQEAGRQKRWLSRKAWRTNKNARYPKYGRK